MLEDYLGKEIKLYGRVRQVMNTKTIFIHIERNQQRNQLMIRKDSAVYETAKKVANMDIIEAKGIVEKNQRGNYVLCPTELTILNKVEQKIGKVYSDDSLISDPEKIYRHPYIGMIKDGSLTNVLKFQHKLINLLRNSLNGYGFTEVYTPVLIHTNGGAKAKPFKTKHNALGQDMVLRIAPELNLKKLLVGGLEDVYEIGPSFRNEGIDKTHNPEFISLEAYKSYEDFNYWIDWFKSIILEIGNINDDLFEKIKDTKIVQISIKSFNWDYEKIIDNLDNYTKELPDDQITIITDFPSYDSPLAARSSDNLYCDRFEVYFGSMEVINGYTELTDSNLQRKIMIEQSSEDCQYDEEFCNSLEYGLMPCTGIGIGISRVVMWLLNKSSIKDVLSFPFYKINK